MGKVINGVFATPNTKARFGWGVESAKLGRLTWILLGLVALSCSAITAYLLLNLPSTVMDDLDGMGYGVASTLIFIFVIAPLFAVGLVFIAHSDGKTITPRNFALGVALILCVSSGISYWQGQLSEKLAVKRSQIHSIQRHLAVEAFVERMNLTGKEKENMLAKTEALPDTALCTAGILTLSICRTLITKE